MWRVAIVRRNDVRCCSLLLRRRRRPGAVPIGIAISGLTYEYSYDTIIIVLYVLN